MGNFQEALKNLLNQCSMENGSNTPDHILAQYLLGCLAAFDKAVQQRATWYGRGLKPTFATLEAAAKATITAPKRRARKCEK